MKFISAHFDQLMLLPPDITEKIPEGHKCFFIRNLVRELDLSPLVSRLINSLLMFFGETGHFQGGVKLPPRRFADPLRGASPPPSNSPAVLLKKTPSI